VFSFAESEQIARPTTTPSQSTHLPTLITSLNFLPAEPPNTTPDRSATPPAPPKQPHRSPPLSATIPLPPCYAYG
jgi:hypothetical protein